ncbi:hypothetical protein C8J57DRAFT_472969 [Mycena rebaudengoi]|nr:hypothetical protein C8J57DRAFT_472969 [Mycena rebaudengoi]
MAAVFPNAQHFIITGSVFNNTAISGTTETPSDFRKILLGELKLLHEIKVEKGMADRRRSCGQPSLRRMYTAQIYGGASFMTAATYHGSDAEKRWREDIATYSRIRHPCFLQLYATVESGQLYVSIFHDDLIDIGHVRRRQATIFILSSESRWGTPRTHLGLGVQVADSASTSLIEARIHPLSDFPTAL